MNVPIQSAGLRQALAIATMRWQIGRNLFRGSGTANQVMVGIFLCVAVLGSLGTFVAAVGWGHVFLDQVGLDRLIYLWDFLVIIFLMMWLAGLTWELQQSEMLSLQNLLHLPVSLSAAFLLNYLGSIVSLTVLVLLPVMLGLCFAAVVHTGVVAALSFVLVAAFVIMVTSVAHLIRGWLAKLMENPRTSRTTMAVVTVSVVVLFQIPALLNLTRRYRPVIKDQAMKQYDFEYRTLITKLQLGELDQAEYDTVINAAEQKLSDTRGKIADAKWRQRVEFVNKAFPGFWLAYGASRAASGSILIPIACSSGMFLIGLFCLMLSYRRTVRRYLKAGGSLPTTKVTTTKTDPKLASRLEGHLPFLSGPQSVVALAALRTTLRASETKLALITPLIFGLWFLVPVVSSQSHFSLQWESPWMLLVIIVAVLFGASLLMINLFGPDRQGFHAFILMPIDRRDILLGKNASWFILLGGLTGIFVLGFGVVFKVPTAYLLATLVQVMITLLCQFPITNQASVFAPVAWKAGTTNPVQLRLGPAIAQMLMMGLGMLAILPAVVALAVDRGGNFIFDVPTWMNRFCPIYLWVTLLQLPLAFAVYRFLLTRQGQALQDREQAILEVVCKTAA